MTLSEMRKNNTAEFLYYTMSAGKRHREVDLFSSNASI